MSEPRTTVHVRINDAATGKPTPVRLRIEDAQGRYCPPLGRLAKFGTGMGEDVGGNLLWGDDKEYAFVDGTCEVPLPPGPITVVASKGPEYRPLRQVVALPAGKLALRLAIERWTDLRAQGWYSGDTWAHYLSPAAALLEAAAEDVAVVNILASEGLLFGEGGRQFPTISNILDFSGQKPAAEMPGHLVVVNTLNHHDTLGRLALLNCHRPVYPLRFGGLDGVDDWTLDEWCNQCHRKGGLVVGHNFFGHYEGHPHGELLADLIRGKVDALQLNHTFDCPEWDVSDLAEWHQLLDCGLRVPLVAGSDKDSNLFALGAKRTYTRLRPGEDFSYKTWIEAVRAGRTFVTNGPLLDFTVDGEDPGATVDVPAAKPTVRVRAEARGLAAFDRVEVIANGAVVAAAPSALETEVVLPQGGWLTARCLGPYDTALENWTGAQSSPIYVTVDGKPRPPDSAAAAHFAGLLQKTLDWIAGEAKCPTERDRERLAHIVREALARLRR